MDLMQLRRNILLSLIGGEDMGAWNKKTITADATYSNAEDVKTWLTGELPNNAQNAIIAKEDLDKTGWANNQFIMASVFDGTFFQWVRYRNSSYANGSNWTNQYDVVVTQGEEYTIFYQ